MVKMKGVFEPSIEPNICPEVYILHPLPPRPQVGRENTKKTSKKAGKNEDACAQNGNKCVF